MKHLIILTLLFLSSCAGYQTTTRFNVHQCVKMCSMNSVAAMENFGCVCNKERSGASSNMNRNYNNATGNNTIIYNTPPAAQNGGSANGFINAASMLLQYENQQMDRMSRDLNPQYVPAPQYPANGNGQGNYNYGIMNPIPTNSFGGF